MGRELLAESAAYSRALVACANALKPFGIDRLTTFSQEDGFSDPVMNAVGLTALQVISFSSSSSTQHPQLLPFGCALQETHQTPLSLKSFYVGSFMYESLMHMANS
jgi:hypothetical protein